MDEFNYDLEYIATGSSEKEWNEEKQVNEPQIKGTNLKPITIADGTGTITKVGEQADNWYSYKTKTEEGLSTWANAVSEGSSDEYDSYWVWIPRFAYKLTKGDGGANGTIDIVFLKGTTDKPASTTSEGESTEGITIKRASEVTESDTNVYIVHPAFTNESGNGYANGGWDREIPGFWIAKFEAGYVGEIGNKNGKAKDSPVRYTTLQSYTETKGEESLDTVYSGTRTVSSTAIDWPTFQPLRPSFNYIGISDAYELCKAIDGSDNGSQGNPYKLGKVDSHLTKNSEWGAVAYLSYSDYGKGSASEVGINSANAGNSEGGIWAVTGYGDIASGGTVPMNLTNLVTEHTAAKAWYTSDGDDASTTGNVSGVYDMSGGLWEWTAGYIAPSSENYQSFGGKFKDEANDKYRSKYAYSGGATIQNYNEPANKKRKGEAIWETSSSGAGGDTSWNSDASSFVYADHPFTMRGGVCYGKTSAGVFAFTRHTGMCYYDVGFRPVLVCE